MTQNEFVNGLRILLNLDQVELEHAGVIPGDDFKAWQYFYNDPFRWLIRADNIRAGNLWALMQTRMKPRDGDVEGGR